MSQSIAILGATGVIGQGAALAFLKAGFTVVAQSREQGKLEELKAKLAKKGADVGKLHLVTGSFQSGDEAKAVAAAVQKLVGVPKHVLSILGFVDTLPKLASETTPEDINNNWSNSLWPTIRSANAFVPLLKGKAGSTFTQLSGGLAHGVFVPQVWSGSLKNATVNSWAMVLDAELKEDALRFSNVCVHFGVAPFGGDKNQFGMPAADTERFGPFFVAVASKSTHRGTICLNTIDDATKFVESNK